MFIGHFGAGFAAKGISRETSLGTLFLAAQFIDLLWPTLLLLDIERVRIVPGITAVTPLLFEYYPVSHSLVAVFGWALLVGGVHYLLKRRRAAAFVLGGLVVSHWLLDAVVHRPDLPVMPGGDMLVGLNAWSSLPLTLAIELSLFGLGTWIYLRNTAATDAVGRYGLAALVGFLLLVYAGNLLGDPPPGATAIAWVGQAQWIIVIWAYWVDAHRRVLAPRQGAGTTSVPGRAAGT